MSLSHLRFSPRARAISVASIAALSATALAALPASANPGCDNLAADIDQLQEELECAGESTTASYTITLTQDFTVPAGTAATYTGTANLIIDGAGHTVTGSSDLPAGAEGTPFLILGREVQLLDILSISELPEFDVEIHNLEATGFTSSGVILSHTIGELSVVSSSFLNNASASAGAGEIDPFSWQGGVLSVMGSATVTDSIFAGNSSSTLGGAIFMNPLGHLIASILEQDAPTPTLTISASHFEGNSSSLQGGAVVGYDSTHVTDSVFIENSAHVGGALAITTDMPETRELTITGSEFSGNETTRATPGSALEDGEAGGAIFTNMDSTIKETIFTDNGSANQGGTIYFYNDNTDPDNPPQLAVIDSVITDSTAEGAGGAIWAEGDITLSGTTVSGSRARWSTVAGFGKAVIEDSTFVNNATTNGASVTVVSPEDGSTVVSPEDGSVSVHNSTFTGNTAESDDSVGALAIAIDMAGDVSLAHNTFANNAGGGGNDLTVVVADGSATLHGNAFTSTTDVPSCHISAETHAAFNFDADGSCTDNWAEETNFGEGLDPLLGVLTNNGGLTPTLLPLEGSPLIDAIPTHAGSPVSTDQRGINRPQGDGYDIGAVEIETTVDDTEDDTEDDTDTGDTDTGDTDTGDTDTEGDTNLGDDTGTGGHDAGLVRFHVTTDAGTLHGTASPAITVTNITWTPTTHLTGAPADTALPYGAAGFTIQVPQPGASTTITLTAPTPFTNAYKTSNGTWTTIPGATWSPDSTTITYTLTDGGPLDEDGHPNGYIIDPIALALTPTFTG